MTEYVVPAAVLGLVCLALQCALGAIKLARGFLAERNGTAARPPDIVAVIAKLDVRAGVVDEKLGSIDRRLDGVHRSVHDLRDALQPIITQVALHEHRLNALEERQS